MLPISSPSSHDPALTELVQHSSQALLQKKAERLSEHSATSRSDSTHRNPPGAISSQGDLLHVSVSAGAHQVASSLVAQPHSYAMPLSPLRDRDLKALADLFLQEAIEEIEADILANLLNRFPEPCWEDHVFDFLKDYL
ncbi:hypothetical protein H6G89_16535 [Oscillatoria sp. FACHB-1407]|uniref:hypothetical protein n=1 Tax=Oscillatoria sp. FACHB-1407 TaxID=2692847 RepID=UPI0016834D37|nr:hypothetical protein [Oscillatoria sp. FACHB-1407]MBD2462649.1 hypothetical protein [Oscillatoria sp. FACHB-1407]